jgi:hypothetical protein
MEIVPLSNSIGGGDARAPGFVIAADVSTPYQLLSEIFYTLGQRDVASPGILVRSGTSQRVSRFSLGGRERDDPCFTQELKVMRVGLLRPSSRDGGLEDLVSAVADVAPPPSRVTPLIERQARVPAEPALCPSVLVVPQGFVISALGYRIGTGCEGTGAGVTVPNVSSYDFAGLTRCLVRLKASAPDVGKETRAVLTANADVPLQTIVSTADALRSSPDGGILFPDVVLGIVR